MAGKKSKPSKLRFAAVPLSHLPKGHSGKHARFVMDVFTDLSRIGVNAALRIPVSELPGSKAEVRSALHRGAKKRTLQIATTSDSKSFYVWIAADGSSLRFRR